MRGEQSGFLKEFQNELEEKQYFLIENLIKDNYFENLFELNDYIRVCL